MSDLERVIRAIQHHESCERCRRRFVNVVLFGARTEPKET